MMGNGSIIDVVVLSAGEAEYGVAFVVAQQDVWLRNFAVALRHPQPSTKNSVEDQRG
jgi:hypothetical protein